MNQIRSASSRRSRLQLVLASMGALALVLAAGCGGDDDEEPGSPSVPTIEAPMVVAPLTGEELSSDRGETLERPALVVKIDNVDGRSRPQAGLNQADVVYEEMVEGRITRFAAVFHSQGADAVGPVRSGRSTDVELVAPLARPLFAYSGANGPTLELLRAAALIDVGVDVAPDAYERVPDRSAPDNLFSSTGALWAAAPSDDSRPPSALFSYRDADDPDAGQPVEGFTYSFGGAVGVEMRWDVEANGWARTQGGTSHVDTDGVVIAPTNVIVQFVDYIDTGLVDAAGAPVPEAVLVGDGAAWVFSAGALIEGRWNRTGSESPTTFRSDAGDEALLEPGTTWVILLPLDAPASVVEPTDPEA